MHDHGFPQNPPDSNWMQGFCGGKFHQWSPAIRGKCGICGDPWDASPREHEAPGGKFANGIITRNYTPGQVITVRSHITANHLGYVEVRLCRNNDVTHDPDQSCFDQPGALLTFVSTGENKLWVTEAMGGDPKIDALVKLPDWECEHCILQWTYRNGRDWGTCNGACGEVETFRACSDISISYNEESNTTDVSPSLTSSTQPTTVEPGQPSTTTEPGPEKTTSELTTTKTTLSPDTTCKAIGPWAGDSKHDAWCNENCFHDPPYCPQDICLCSESYKAKTETRCKATGLWTGNQGISVWCENNCNSVEAYCPGSICKC
eukprot:TRINITY_DN24376_c0_g1_i1.p1 TRINITY_DN24376_c0_g1~~TRINITY_DN24376_c0_g1_i1.p1  ORF type:complete len:350 (-),score=50.99 TRINITY_DN24376_c0_g1_i1:118-1071(-)